MITNLRFVDHPAIWSLTLGSVARYALFLYYFLDVGFVCDNALPATDFVLRLVLPSLKRDEALRATVRDVCLLLFFAI